MEWAIIDGQLRLMTMPGRGKRGPICNGDIDLCWAMVYDHDRSRCIVRRRRRAPADGPSWATEGGKQEYHVDRLTGLRQFASSSRRWSCSHDPGRGAHSSNDALGIPNSASAAKSLAATRWSQYRVERLRRGFTSGAPPRRHGVPRSPRGRRLLAPGGPGCDRRTPRRCHPKLVRACTL